MALANLMRQFASNIMPMAAQKDSMPTAQLNIVLHEPRVLAGDTLQAKVLLDSADPDTVIYSLEAEVRGYGRTGWVNIHTDKIFETEREYVNQRVALCASNFSLPPGRHQFPLKIKIPETAPSSYESQFGTVRYHIKVMLVSNSDQATATELFPFIVISRSFFDNLPPGALRQIDYKDEIDFTCFTLPFGTVTLRMLLPRTGYRIGELITAYVRVKNRTRKGLKACSLQLCMKTQLEAKSRYEHVNEQKLVEQLVDQVNLGNVIARSEQEFPPVTVHIPETAPPTQSSHAFGTDEPSIIAIHYVLKFVALPGIECEMPIIVCSRGFSCEQKQHAFLVHSQVMHDRILSHHFDKMAERDGSVGENGDLNDGQPLRKISIIEEANTEYL